MHRRTLSLQTGAEQVKRIDDGGTQSAAESADGARGEVARGGVVLVAVAAQGVAVRQRAFEVLEGAQVDSGVGEHADEAHGQAPVEGA